MTATINISLPKSMYLDAKKVLAQKGYTSISEFIRDALREKLYPNLTVNGFTPEFEEEVLRIANNPDEEYIEWDGKTPFTEFVLSHPPKKIQKNGKARVHGQLLPTSTETVKRGSKPSGFNFAQS